MLRIRLCAGVLLVILILPLMLSGCKNALIDEYYAPVQTMEDNALPDHDSLAIVSESPMDVSLPDQTALTILFFSDTQPDPETADYTGFGELLAQAVAMHETPDIIIFGGDTVNDGGDEDEWAAFKQSAGTWLEGSITAAVAGNHDNYPLLARQFDYPNEAPLRQGEGYYYTFDMGPAFFIMLDSNIMGAAKQEDIDWLQNELKSSAARKADWIIVIMHHPMWPVADNPKDFQRADTMRENFLSLLEANNVALILCGHQHVYSRTKPMTGEAAENNGSSIVQIMAASGDKATYTITESDYIEASASAPNYVLLKADEQSLDAVAYDREGSVIDKYTMHK